MSAALDSLLDAARLADCQRNEKNMNNAHRINHTRPIRARNEHLEPANEPIRKSDRVGLLDPSFVYVPAAETDLRATFKRIREQMARAA